LKASDETRRTLDELRVEHELFEDLRDVYVEGRHDRLALQAFFRWAEVRTSVRVYEIDQRLDLPASELFALSLEDGRRSRLIALALSANSWPSRRGLTAVIDADAAYAGSPVPADVDTLLITDGTSIEAYALNSSTLDKFLALTLRRDGHGDKLLSDLQSPLREMFVARRVLHEAKTGSSLSATCLKRFPVINGVISCTAEELLLTSQPRLSPSELGDLVPQCAEVRRQLPLEIHKCARGHDIALVLIASMDLKAAWAHPETVEGGLIGNLDFPSLSQQPMFKALLTRVA